MEKVRNEIKQEQLVQFLSTMIRKTGNVDFQINAKKRFLLT